LEEETVLHRRLAAVTLAAALALPCALPVRAHDLDDPNAVTKQARAARIREQGFPASVKRPAHARNVSVVGQLPLGSWNGDIWAHKGFVYVGNWVAPCDSKGVRIVDATDPKNPKLVGSLAGVGNGAHYMNSSTEDVHVMSVSTPYFKGDLLATGLQRCGSSAPARTRGLDLWDVTDPYNPKFLAFLPTDTRAVANAQLARGVHELFLFERNGGVYGALSVTDSETKGAGGDYRLVDLTDPRNPVQLSDWGIRRDRGYDATGQSVFNHSSSTNQNGTLAYLAYWDAGLVTLDISNLRQPRFVSRGVRPSGPGALHSAVAARGSNLVVTTDEQFDHEYRPSALGDTRIWDMSSPAAPRQVGYYEVPSQSETIHNPVVRGSTLFLSGYFDGLRVLDISRPSAPRETAAFKPEGASFWGVVVEGELIYISDELYGLYILKLTPSRNS
jgi:hypothetical protein